MQKIYLLAAFLSGGLLTYLAVNAFPKPGGEPGYIIEKEQQIRQLQPSPHKAPGTTAAYPFFRNVKGFGLVFRKRILLPGSSIGYHLQEKDEIYYIMEGKGILTMNGKEIAVEAGDAILTRPGNSHGLRPLQDSLSVIINYREDQNPG